ncbi:HAD hydrolase family protein, partial [Bacillus pumilus]|uniref:HAD hydrolase family protein n=1 Tax=Bacillus pumilus TaxID=1408 RepID=UPI0034D96C96
MPHLSFTSSPKHIIQVLPKHSPKPHALKNLPPHYRLHPSHIYPIPDTPNHLSIFHQPDHPIPIPNPLHIIKQNTTYITKP